MQELSSRCYNEGMSESKNPKREPVSTVAVIPARGGQQSIPYKNLQKLGGKTLLQWAIDVAFAAEKIDAVLVSTEDERIKKEATDGGALVAPRPTEHAQPASGDAGFYCHAVDWLKAEFGWEPELFVNLRPTSPLRFASDVDAMVAYMQEHPDADGLKSVIPTPLHPYKMWQMEGDGKSVAPVSSLRSLSPSTRLNLDLMCHGKKCSRNSLSFSKMGKLISRADSFCCGQNVLRTTTYGVKIFMATCLIPGPAPILMSQLILSAQKKFIAT